MREADKVKEQKAFRALGLLGKLYNIVVYICGSTSYVREFKNQAGRLILLNNYIRWNSWYYMLSVAEQLAGYIDIYTKNYLTTL